MKITIETNWHLPRPQWPRRVAASIGAYVIRRVAKAGGWGYVALFWVICIVVGGSMGLAQWYGRTHPAAIGGIPDDVFQRALIGAGQDQDTRAAAEAAAAKVKAESASRPFIAP